MKILSKLPQLYRHLARVADREGLRGAAAYSLRRIAGSLRTDGLRGTIARGFRSRPQALPQKPQVPQTPHPFDLLHGTDTGQAANATADGLSVGAIYANGYLGIAPSALVQALSNLPAKLDELTFIDLGCGKGRALLVASGFPFRRIVGVELVPELCTIARANVASRPEWANRITVIEHDATSVAFPDGPLLLFLYHPFFAPALRRVLANLERQLRRAPRETWVLYADNPRFTKVMRRFPFLREISETSYSLSAEDAAAVRFGQQQFTLYIAKVKHSR